VGNRWQPGVDACTAASAADAQGYTLHDHDGRTTATLAPMLGSRDDFSIRDRAGSPNRHPAPPPRWRQRRARYAKRRARYAKTHHGALWSGAAECGVWLAAGY
jgi:hypothetical protein